jgi:Domain of unknown function (DUF4252)
MKTAPIFFRATLFAAAIPAFAQQNFDFKTLDKLGANATESANITLEGDTLKLATSFLGSDNGALKSLTGVYVRSFEFAKEKQYDPADLAPLRAYIKTLKWTKIVDVKEATETSEIYVQTLPNNKLGGLAIVAAEPKEVSVVFIAGVLDMSDIGKLGGNLGIPDIKLNHDGKKADNPKPDNPKKD